MMDITTVAIRVLDMYATGGIIIAGLVALWGIIQGVNMFRVAVYDASIEDDLNLDYDDYAFYQHLDNLNNDRVELTDSDVFYSYQVPYYDFIEPLVDDVYLHDEISYATDEYGMPIESEWHDSDYVSPIYFSDLTVVDQFGNEVESEWI